MSDSDIRIRASANSSINHPDNETHLSGEKASKSNHTARRDNESKGIFAGIKAALKDFYISVFGSSDEKAVRENQRVEKKLTGSIDALTQGIMKGVATEGMMDNCLSIMAQAKKKNPDFPKMGVHDKMMEVLGNLSTEDLQQMQKGGISKLERELKSICETATKESAYFKEDPYNANLKNMEVPQESESTKQIIQSRQNDISIVMDVISDIVTQELENRARNW